MVQTREHIEDCLREIELVFTKYSHTFPLSASPISVSVEMQRDLENDTYNTLPMYLTKAANVWGTVSDFKSFLPTILRGVALDRHHFWSSSDLRWTLDSMNFRQWPEDEQSAIDSLFRALWEVVLGTYGETDILYAYELLEIVDRPTQFLKVWQSRLPQLPALLQFAHLVNTRYGVLYMGFNDVGISPEIDSWVITEINLTRLEAAYLDHMNLDEAEQLSEAAEHLQWLLWHSQ